MRRHFSTVVIVLLFVSSAGRAQERSEMIDTSAIAKIKEEGLRNSQVMNLLTWLCDDYGPRLTWSPEYRRAAGWVSGKLTEWGLQHVHYARWAPVGEGWTLKKFSAMVTAPVPYPVIGYPSAWSPGFKEKEADVIFLDARKPEDLEKYRGKLKGEYVLISNPVEIKAHWEPQATRLADSVLLRMANADAQSARRGRRARFGRIATQNIDSALATMRQANPEIDSAAFVNQILDARIAPRKLEFAQEQGAIAAISAGRGDDGTVLVQAASVPRRIEGADTLRLSPYDPKTPRIIPQVVFDAEHYDRIVRMLRNGERVRLNMELEVATTKADSGFNIIGEIPGTDLKEELVMLGAHFDTWHSGTGATDDNTGTAACLETVRILQTLSQKYGMRPRRTVRIALWGGEEQGLIGSRQYVATTFARRDTSFLARATGSAEENPRNLTKTPEYDKLSVYFNHDNGTGRIRGVYIQGNEAARPIFRTWLSACADPTAQTLTILGTGGTDHVSFDAVGLPAFQFIQDPIEYETRTHHFNMDTFERIQEPDMKQGATIMACFVYNAAMRDAKFPRKPMTAQPGGR